MRLLTALSIAGLSFGCHAQVLDVTTAALVRTSYVSSLLTSAPFENKLVIGARDDAASFVASDGLMRGARLEAVLTRLRQTSPELAASDRELAEAILVQ
ncbi:Holliday junction resolvase [Stutzerimonas nosocomialis]|uniref:Holliday junction resolvase n=1 Tax=Stutzerimonas nosocomialis TaxID=1056496 RepID=A0A5R9QBJ3_9GAMM|nr:DUF2388 domain-containing protein [Stutzerimonas nosocomialis]TLX57672.1 Holliday junction resolvase [Stutzerimonas nosocomialis]TLX62471.1 Holliday junction resolvase [Stutzerimonas nosocomialis]